MLAEVLEPIETRKGMLNAGDKVDIPESIATQLKNKIRLIEKRPVHSVAKIVNGELICLHPVDDLAAVIVGLTENNLPLQKKLLLRHCQRYDPVTHFWTLRGKWEERAAILEYDAGLTREDAEVSAAEMYHLSAFMDELLT